MNGKMSSSVRHLINTTTLLKTSVTISIKMNDELQATEFPLFTADEHALSNKYHDEMGVDGMKHQVEVQDRDTFDFNLVLDFLDTGDTVLEMGCGYGRMMNKLLEEGYDVRGVDLNKGYIDYFKNSTEDQTVKDRVSVACMSDTPFADGSFDKVFCVWSTFIHILTEEKQLAAVQEMYRVIRPGGKVLIHMMDGDIPKVDALLKTSGFQNQDRLASCRVMTSKDPVVAYFHTQATLNRLFQKSAFETYSVEHRPRKHTSTLLAILQK